MKKLLILGLVVMMASCSTETTTETTTVTTDTTMVSDTCVVDSVSADTAK
jgi:uncharacterized lipoprotein YajG